MKLLLPTYFSQKDSRWGLKKLGTSTTATLASDGCLLCCASAVLNYHGKDTTPDRLNDDLTRVKGWYKACRLIYGAITDIYQDVLVDWNNYIECADVGAPLDKIDEILESKRIPIVKVDYNPKTATLDEHWVAIIGKDESGSYLIYDPIDGSEQYFHARYGDPARYIFKIVVYSGPIKEEENVENTIKDLQDKVTNQAEQILQLGTQNGVLEAELTRQEAENSRLNKSLTEERTKSSSLLGEKKNLEGKVEKLENSIATLEGKLIGVKEALKASEDKAIEAFGGWKLIWEGVIRLFKRR